MSFYDEGDEPRTTRAAPRPRRAASSRPGPVDEQTLLIRRAVAAGVGLIILILIVLGIRGCVNSQKISGLKTYNNNVSAIASQSVHQVAQPLFGLLNGAAGKGPINAEVSIDQYRSIAAAEAARAKSLSVPGEMAGAQQNLLLALDMRAEALQKMAANIRSALQGTTSAAAITAITGQMEVLLASDVIYADRVAPLIEQVFADHNVGGQTVASSQFVPDLGWLSQQTVSQRILGHAVSGAGGTSCTSLCGHGLSSVSAGGQTLTPGTIVNNVTYSPNLTFTLQVANQGNQNEFGVGVSLSIQGAGRPINASNTIAETMPGQTATAQIPLTTMPPIGTPVRLVASVASVPGEKTLSNNSLSYLVVFGH